MDTTSDTAQPCAPYVSFKTFLSGVQALRIHGLPKQVDRSVWASKSGADQTALLSAFRFLGLIDSNDSTQPSLSRLTDAQEATQSEKDALEHILRQRYAELFVLDLETVTPARLSEAVGKYRSQGSTRDRSIRFFLKATEYCGVKTSGRLKVRRPRGTGSPAKNNGKKTGDLRSKTQPPDTQSPAAMKVTDLPQARGILTLSGTFNAFELVGAERDLVYSIIDKMKEFEATTVDKEEK